MSTFFNVDKFSLLATQAAVFFIAACCFEVKAQINSDTEYYTSLNDYSHFSSHFTNRYNSFALKVKGDKSLNTKYVSNSKRIVGIGAHLFNMGLGIAFPVAKGDGVRKNFDFRANVAHRRWGLDFLLQKYRGFTGDVNREDITLGNIMLDGYYVFNHRRYSLPASINFLEKQNRSAGSFLGHVVFSRGRQRADSALFENDPALPFDTVRALQGTRYLYSGVLPGYGFTITRNSFFVNLALSLGPVHVWKKYDHGQFVRKDISFEWATVGRTTIGINNEKWFCGAGASLSRLEFDFEQISVLTSSWQIKLFAGVRFLEKGLFRKSISDFK